MKKLLVVLLSLGLIAAFAATGSADTSSVKFQGAYYVAGIYDDNPTLADKNDSTAQKSMALFHQRLRMQPIFQVADGLTFTMRFDAMEKTWGNTDGLLVNNTLSTAKPTANSTNTISKTSEVASGRSFNPNTNRYLQENIELEYTFITAKMGMGTLDAGYMEAPIDRFGTDMGNSSNSRPVLKFTQPIGNLTVTYVYEKWYESDLAGKNVGTYYYVNPVTGKTTNNTAYPTYATDMDADRYGMMGVYKLQNGEVGALYAYFDNRQPSNGAAASYKQQYHTLGAYEKLTFGNFFLESEVQYAFGKAKKVDNPSATSVDVDASTLIGMIHGKFTFGPAYAGALALYASGNNPDDPADKQGKELIGKGTSMNTFLIALGGDRLNFLSNGGGMAAGGDLGTNNPNGAQAIDDGTKNIIAYLGYVGYNPTPKLNIEAAFGAVARDQKPFANYVSKSVGTEVDLKINYKLYDNLSYFVGAGYLWTGDYFKGTKDSNVVGNDYMFMNRLQLTF